MRKPAISKAIFTSVFITFCILLSAQGPLPQKVETRSSVVKPYKVLTNGKQITIQAKQNLKSVIVWTSSGHRIVEQKEINNFSCSFTVPPKENIFFLMLETSEGKRFTEKIGVK